MKQTLEDVRTSELADTVVLVRADLNVPLEQGVIADDLRIRESLPTLRHLSEAGARVVLLTHLGRPRGEPDPGLSVGPVARRLGELLERSVRFCPASSGDPVLEALQELPAGGVLVLENTRFDPREKANDPTLCAEWASLGSLFVNDAFGTAHRAHASTAGLAEAVRDAGGRAVAGRLLAREIRMLRSVLDDPTRPFVAILGGAKISGKVDVIQALLPRLDRLLVGGAMANTFFRAMGLEVGASLVEEDRVDMARATLKQAGDRLLLPVDCVVADRIAEDATSRVVPRDEVGDGDRVVDIGPATRRLYAEELATAGTVLWNGPMGIFEMEPFAEGTRSVARAAAEACDGGATVVVGGGDSSSAAREAGLADRFTHISTGGGASLEFLAGTELPGVVTLSEKD